MLALMITMLGGLFLVVFFLRRRRRSGDAAPGDLAFAMAGAGAGVTSPNGPPVGGVAAAAATVGAGRPPKPAPTRAKSPKSAPPAPVQAATVRPAQAPPISPLLAAKAKADASKGSNKADAKDAKKVVAAKGAPKGPERFHIGYRGVRLGDGPDEFRSTELGRLDRGDEVEILGSHEGFLQVRTPAGLTGWIPRHTITGSPIGGT